MWEGTGMLMYIVSVLMIVLVISNFVFSKILYKEPQSDEFFSNVKNISIPKEKYILPDPKFVLGISVLTGIAVGLYVALCKFSQIEFWMTWITILFVAFFYFYDMENKAIIIVVFTCEWI